jgi:hypothetical protein
MGDDGARITTPPIAWHYAAGVHLDYAAVDFDRQHCWIRLRVRDVEGAILAGLYDADRDQLSRERAVPPGADVQDIDIPVFEPNGALLVFRTAAAPVSATATVLQVQILTASAYQPEMLDLARHLADEGGL